MQTDQINTITVKEHKTAGHYHLIIAKAVHAFTYNAGQYCFLYYDLKDKNLKRPYSIASAPNNQRMIEFCIADSDDHKLQKILGTLSTDTTLQISDPAGNFQRPSADKKICMIAGGSGIAPLRSMLLERLHSDDVKEAPTELIFGSINAEALPYHDEFQRLDSDLECFRYSPVVQNQGSLKNQIMVGNVLDQLKNADLADEYFLCGPPAMIDVVKAHLDQRGISEEQIFTDRY